MTDWFVLDIPRPPSVNRFMSRLGNKSPCVVKWRTQADGYLRAAGKYPRIKGQYWLCVTFPVSKFGKFDGENCLKALSDWLQSRELVENDRLARMIILDWGDAPEGLRIRLTSWSDEA